MASKKPASKSSRAIAKIFKTVQRVCRLCCGEEDLEDIFKQKDIQQWISEYLSITVSETDEISHSICADCRTRLKEIYDFQQRCFEVQDVLRSDPFSEKPGGYECEVCNKMFREKKIYRNHMRTHSSRLVEHRKKSETCRTDKAEIVSNDEAEETVNQEDQTNPTMEGELCVKKFKSERQLTDHRSPVVGTKDYKCSMCDMTFITKQRLDLHFESHLFGEPSAEAKFDPEERQVCPICNRTIRRASMEGHMNIHKGRQPYTCERGCSETFFCEVQRNKHYLRAHGKQSHECDICHQNFHSTAVCRWHKMKEHGKGHECRECFLVFKTSEEYEKHLATTNHTKMIPTDEQQPMEENTEVAEPTDLFEAEDVKPEIQNLHWSGSDSKEYLGDDSVELIEVDDSDEDEREKVQLARNKLVEHNATNEVQKSNGQSDTDPQQERKYQCQICPKTFIHKLHLHAHSAVHKRISHACTLCSKRYRSSYYLEKHMQSHEGLLNISGQFNKELPILTCSICGKVAQSRPHLLYHMQMQHGMDMESDGVSAEPSSSNADDLFEIEEIKVEISDD